MADGTITEGQTTSDGAASVAEADLATMLNQAYLAGDGAAVEHIMALIAASQGVPFRAA
jgi:hypothetical protein